MERDLQSDQVVVLMYSITINYLLIYCGSATNQNIQKQPFDDDKPSQSLLSLYQNLVMFMNIKAYVDCNENIFNLLKKSFRKH